MPHSHSSSQHPPLTQLVQEVTRAISPPSSPLNFNELALLAFSTQYQNNRAYRNYCDQLGKSPTTVATWQEIPMVPTDAYKFHSHPLVSFPIEQTEHTFHTSGTTTELKGHHHFPSIELYERSILEGWKQTAPTWAQTATTAIILTPKPEDAPHSSLSHMMGTLTEHWGCSTTWGIKSNGELDTQAIVSALNHSITNQQPIALLGTALAFLHFFEQDPIPHFQLPEGSWAMETGGYKGTQRSLKKEELYAMFTQHLGIPLDFVINEYSMTELSSQFYTQGLNRPHTGPEWIRIRAIDPITGLDAAPGNLGHLAIYDLANAYSVIAIQTQDLAIAHDDRSFTLIGRDPSALPRGCSRAADDTLTLNSLPS